MEEKFLNTINKHNLIKNGSVVAVALSGGADSVCLLHLLNKYKENLNIKIIAFHVNHNIRGLESDADEEFVKNLCKQLNISLYCKSVNALDYAKTEKLSVETSARELRYKAFCELKAESGADVVCLAHHSDDQAETILMHLYRGCELNGLIGMAYCNDFYIRPLLDISKAEILEYTSKNNLEYVTDQTNFDNNYSRNFVRNVIINNCPTLKQSLINISNQAVMVEKNIAELIDETKIIKDGTGVKILNDIFNEPEFIVTRSIRYAISLVASLVDIEEKHIKLVMELFKCQVGKVINLPHLINCIKQHDCVYVFLNKKSKEESLIEFGVGTFEFNGAKYTVSDHKPSFACHKFDLDKIPVGAIWRNYKNGDELIKFGGGKTTVKSYLTNKKISARERDNMPMLMDNTNCLIVGVVDISETIKVDNLTTRVGYFWKN